MRLLHLVLPALAALLPSAQAFALPDWSCPRASRLWCEAGEPCLEAEVTPFVLLLLAAKGEVEFCEGEHCEYGVFAPAEPPRPDAARGLSFGWATVEPSPLPAAYAGRVYAVTLDEAAASVTLVRASAEALEVIRAGACRPWP